MRISTIATFVAALLLLSGYKPLSAQTLPPGFSQVLVAPGITQPTTMAYTPDGRFFICEQTGAVKVLKNDTLLSRPFITLTTNLNGERGLVGIAIDPDFTNNQYVYLCYTIPTGEFNRVSRFTASGDTVVPGSEIVLLETDTMIANYHGGGHLQIGPDGKLYVAVGENGRSALSQDLNSYLGKILRINLDGSTPSDNPFPGPGKQRNIWAYGLRNPFTFSFQPSTGRFFINDVGEITWEEINDATAGGGNYGWPLAEGVSSDTAFDNPFYSYLHGLSTGQGCAITGGDFFDPDTTNYPTAYQDKYYFIDYCGNWIDYITLSYPPVWSHFASNVANYSVGLMTGPDGNLYFLSRNNEALYKIAYSPNPAAVVVNEPLDQLVSLGYPANFSVSASGTPPFQSQWYKGTTLLLNDTNATLNIPNCAFADSGDYRVVVSNAFGSDTSRYAHLSVTANQPPVAVINTPLPGAHYSGGDLISFSGDANDPEDGVLPDSAFQWVVIFHHDAHVHPGPNAGSGIRSGAFLVPTTGEVSPNVFFRLYLIVRDAEGLVDSAFVDLQPNLSDFTINTQPQGLTIYVDGQPHIAPHTVTGVEGMYRNFGAPWSQVSGPSTYFFTRWDNGGALTQTFRTPVNDTAWTAFYGEDVLPFTLNDTVVCINSTLQLSPAGYNSYAWSDGTTGNNYTFDSSVPDTFSIGLTVTDGSGQAGSDSITVIFDVCDQVGTPLGDRIALYPVPSTGRINISESPVPYRLVITDLTGRAVWVESVPAGNVKQLKLPSGVFHFLLQAEQQEILLSRKVVVLE
ncbi:MAG: PQQ-dependent sugar dehydrogenase [Bacteroidia bacterium]|nr:PQQ-dependent sugar dehydrogenase [Bacteroidia bacterium]